MFENQAQSNRNFRIAKLVLTSTGTYNPQYRRPWNTRGDGQALKLLGNALDGVSHITPQQLASVANMLVEPQAQPESATPISMVGDGWGGNRLAFMMVIEYTNAVGVTIQEVVSGYTDHYGISMGGAIDPQMVFYVNSVIQLRVSQDTSPFGTQIYSTILDNSQILTDNQFNQHGGAYNPNLGYQIRPEDVFTTMTTSHMDRTKLTDTRVANESQPKKTRREDNMAANYMASVLQGWRQANESTDSTASGYELYEKARGVTSNQPIMRDPFFIQLDRQSSGMLSNCFTLGDLSLMDPGLRAPGVIQHAAVGQTQAQQISYAGQSEGWGGSTLMTQIATMLSNAVPALMTELGLSALHIFASNKSFGLEYATQGRFGRTTIETIGPESLISTDLSSYCEIFKNRLFQEILQGVFRYDEIPYQLTMGVNLAVETVIDISILNEPTTRYVTPSFCDALLVPVVTNNSELVTQVATDFEKMANYTTGAVTNNAPWAQGAGGSTFVGSKPLSF